MTKKSLMVHVLIFSIFFVAVRNYRAVPYFYENVDLVETTVDEVPIGAVKDIPYDNFSAGSRKGLVSFSLSFDFKVNDKGQYQNLFQTTDLNQGLRMELGDNGRLGLLYHIQNEIFGSIDFKPKVQLGQWYKFSLDFDGRILHSSLNDEILKASAENLNLQSFNRIRLGIGFNEERSFQGDLRNVHLKLRYSPIKLWAQLLVGGCSLILLGYFLYLLWTSLKFFIPSEAKSRKLRS